jgi:PhnB protein
MKKQNRRGGNKMAEFNAYLRFKGNCREAMQFYHQCLGGRLNLMTVGESPMAAQMPEMRDKIMHSVLTSGSVMIMGSDMADKPYRHGNTVSLCLVCQSKKEIETLFSKLSQGAKTVKPLKEEFFGTYGDLTDKYGFSWMFQFSTNQQGS